jgi:hypothetical protein
VTSLTRTRKQERRPWRAAEAAFGRRVACRYFPILYVRSPAGFLDDSIVSPPLLPRMLTKPRTVCGCQPVAFMISGRVAPFARFLIAITSAFLLVRSAFGLPTTFLARPAFFAGFSFLPGLPFGFAARRFRRRLH